MKEIIFILFIVQVAVFAISVYLDIKNINKMKAEKENEKKSAELNREKAIVKCLHCTRNNNCAFFEIAYMLPGPFGTCKKFEPLNDARWR